VVSFVALFTRRVRLRPEGRSPQGGKTSSHRVNFITKGESPAEGKVSPGREASSHRVNLITKGESPHEGKISARRESLLTEVEPN
jgi:hypothetical protein